MQDNEKKPALRFKGFTDPWEQRKLGDITVELSEYATQELGLPLLTSSRSGLMYQDEYRDSRTTKSTETLFSVVPVGTCTYRHMSDDDVFHMNINTLEKGLVSREYPVFEASKGNNLEFLVQHINSSEEFKAFCAEQKKGGTRTRLYYNTLCQFTVRVPALKEQAQISQCLKKLDTLITLHQRKYEKLVNIKKSMLDKMFPQNGVSVPEIRFKGFTDPWEQRKLGELSRSFEYGLNVAAKEYDGQNKYLRITDIDDTSRQFVSADITSPDANLAEADNYRLSDGDVLFARTGASVGKTYLYKKSDGLVYFAGFLIRAKIKESVSAGFIFQNTLTRSYERYIAITSQRSGQPGVNAQEYAEYQLMLPELFEQEKIAKLLEALDILITLHQREHIKSILEVKLVKRNE